MPKVALILPNLEIIHQNDISQLLKILSSKNYKIYVDEKTLYDISTIYSDYSFYSLNDDYDDMSFGIAFGGDGSMIEAVQILRHRNLPLLGINFGRLGYLTTVEKNDYDSFINILNGIYRTEKRALLSVSVLRNNKVIPMSTLALNEVLLANTPVVKMLTFDLLCNGVPTQTYKADGIVISTPTGSTGYSLSAGGPVISPTLNCMVATPVCPHSLSARPVVFDADVELQLTNIVSRGNQVYISIDGHEIFYLETGDSILVSISSETISLVRKSNDSFLRTLYHKINDKETLL